jgi:thiol-disulfide isomerase/thioredoxin
MQIKPRAKNYKLKYRILATALIGSGLLVVGVVTLVILFKVIPHTSPVRMVENAPASVDFQAPDLQLHNLRSQPVSLQDYRGQFMLVNNWASWCPPCRAEMPILETYFRDHRHQEFVIIGINAGDPASLVADFVNQFNVSFPVWLDPTNGAINAFHNNYLPSSYLIDQKGEVILAWNGAVNRDSLERYITPLLKE